MIDKPLVSIIISSYNYARFLPQAVESALGQTYSRTEVIIVDDGSTDGSSEVMRQYSGQALLIDKPNGGQASAFNTGFGRSRGEVVIFLDSDDSLYPTGCTRGDGSVRSRPVDRQGPLAAGGRRRRR